MINIAIGGIFHETHTFMENTTSLDDFRNQTLVMGDDLITAMRGVRSGIGGMVEGVEAKRWSIRPTLYAAAMPGGVVEDAAFEYLLDQLLSLLQEAQHPLDGVLLPLHGAMVTQSLRDVETEIVTKVRQVVGGNVPIVVELDMHGNVSQQLVDLADVIVAYDTNPHIDPYERGRECVEILSGILDQSLKPTVAFSHTNILLPPQITGTDDEPLRAVHQQRILMEQDPDVIAISIMAGFAYADTVMTGASVIVTTHNQPQKARKMATDLAVMIRKGYRDALPRLVPPHDAVQQAMMNGMGGPVLLVDSADNIGGGTPGDGTDALVAMLAAGVQEGTVVLADPQAVAQCIAAGIGGKLHLVVGGKVDRWHGEPVNVYGAVKDISDGSFVCENPDNHFASFYGTTVHMGQSVWLRVEGVNILLTERKTPPFDLAQLRHIGIQPQAQQMIVVKSAVAYRSAYLPIAADVIEMDTAGLCSANLDRFPYHYANRDA